MRLFIDFEGIDKSGKATQASLLRDWLIVRRFKAEVISFPDYTTEIGLEIKAFLSGLKNFSPEVRQLLYAANRWERKSLIEGWLMDGKIVIADRYTPSGLAYGYANGLPLEWMICIEKGLPQPDVVIVLDISPETSLKRSKGRVDRYESDLKFLETVRSSYKFLAEKFGWYIIDGERAPLEVFNDVINIVSKYLSITR
ncbi:MAG: dTMP kinase [archaeon YNP-LCB-024-027]|nr:dTMP kinase [Candidatus Culexarchaeum yellowstonense]